MDRSMWIVLFSIIAFAACEKKAARCELQQNSVGSYTDDVTGTVEFEQDSASGDVTITVSLEGFDTTDGNSMHGFHVHTDGVTSGANDCSTTGSHYNPDGNSHGPRTASMANRHAGDFGNLEEESDGSITTTFTDSYVSLQGDYNIIGRAIVIHQSEDTLDESVNTSGGAGGRIACCTVEETDVDSAVTSSLSVLTLVTTLLCALFINGRVV